MSLDLKKYERELRSSWESFISAKKAGKWVLYGYEGKSFNLIVCGSGDDGVEEMSEDLSDGRMMYAGVSILDPNSKLVKNVFIIWQGLGVPEQVRGRVTSFSNAILGFFKGFHIHLIARDEDEVSQSVLEKKVASASGSNYSVHKEEKRKDTEPTHVISNYRKVDAEAEIKKSQKSKFWENDSKERMDSETPVVSQSALRAAEVLKLKAKAQNVQEVDTSSSATRAEQIRTERQREMKALIRTSQENVAQTAPSAGNSVSSVHKRVDAAAEIQRLKRTSQQSKTSDEPTVSASHKKLDAADEIRKLRQASQEQSPEKQSEPSASIFKHKPAQTEPQVTSEPVNEDESCARQLQNEMVIETGESSPPTSAPRKLATQSTGITVVAIYDYEATDETEISFNEGETITDVEVTEDAWWIGTNARGQRGSFPSNFIEQEDPQNQQDGGDLEVIPESSFVPFKVVSHYDYESNLEDELSLTEGDILTITEVRDDGWWNAVNSDGKSGLIPSNFVDRI